MKKLTLTLIAATVIWFASCNKPTTETFSPTEDLVTFSFTEYQLEPIRGRGNITFENRIDMWLDDGETVYDYHQEKTSAGAAWGTMYVALNRTKTYTLYAVAHKSDAPATLSEGVISFPNDRVVSSMFYTTTFTPASTTSVECVMQRIIGQFRLCVTDDLPSDFDHITLSYSETGTRFNVNGTAVNKMERSESFTDFYTNTQPKYVGSYIMSDDLTATTYITVTATAYDSNDDVIETKTFTDVPIKDSWRTIYTGEFFTTTGVNFQFSVDDWQQFNDHPY
jgi:3D (Asp-Asp-Asp) domain-containing protein